MRNELEQGLVKLGLAVDPKALTGLCNTLAFKATVAPNGRQKKISEGFWLYGYGSPDKAIPTAYRFV